MLGDRERADTFGAGAAPYSGRSACSGPAVFGAVDTSLGDLALLSGDRARAASHYVRAKDVAARLGAPIMQGEAEAALARARPSTRGRRRGAGSHLRRCGAKRVAPAGETRPLGAVDQLTRCNYRPVTRGFVPSLSWGDPPRKRGRRDATGRIDCFGTGIVRDRGRGRQHEARPGRAGHRPRAWTLPADGARAVSAEPRTLHSGRANTRR